MPIRRLNIAPPGSPTLMAFDPADLDAFVMVSGSWFATNIQTRVLGVWF